MTKFFNLFSFNFFFNLNDFYQVLRVYDASFLYRLLYVLDFPYDSMSPLIGNLYAQLSHGIFAYKEMY